MSPPPAIGCSGPCPCDDACDKPAVEEDIIVLLKCDVVGGGGTLQRSK